MRICFVISLSKCSFHDKWSLAVSFEAEKALFDVWSPLLFIILLVNMPDNIKPHSFSAF